MGSIYRIFKGIFFWHYGRSTWQYDILCVLILAFIFLTPKTWFENSERTSAAAHQTGSSRVYVPGNEPLDNPLDRTEIERRVRSITGQPGVNIGEVRPKSDGQGKIVSYEVDLR